MGVKNKQPGRGVQYFRRAGAADGGDYASVARPPAASTSPGQAVGGTRPLGRLGAGSAGNEGGRVPVTGGGFAPAADARRRPAVLAGRGPGAGREGRVRRRVAGRGRRRTGPGEGPPAAGATSRPAAGRGR